MLHIAVAFSLYISKPYLHNVKWEATGKRLAGRAARGTVVPQLKKGGSAVAAAKDGGSSRVRFSAWPEAGCGQPARTPLWRQRRAVLYGQVTSPFPKTHRADCALRSQATGVGGTSVPGWWICSIKPSSQLTAHSLPSRSATARLISCFVCRVPPGHCSLAQLGQGCGLQVPLQCPFAHPFPLNSLRLSSQGSSEKKLPKTAGALPFCLTCACSSSSD